MALRLEITSKQKRALGERAVKEFGVDGGVIGRSLESDWVLPDPERFVSSRHASIDFRSGSYYIVDTSTNGVYVNDEDVPVGRGNPQRLFNGDRLRVGDYDIEVIIDDESINDPLGSGPHIDPVDRAGRVDGPELTGNDLIDAREITGAVEISDLVAESMEVQRLRDKNKKAVQALELVEPDTPKPTQTQVANPAELDAPKKRAPEVPKKKAAKKQSSVQRKAPQAAPAPTGDPTDWGTFFKAAGIAPRRLDAKESELLKQRLGQLMREMVMGISESLHLRAEHKNTLRLAHTTIQPNNNNPLKFAAGVDEALLNILFKEAPEYLSAQDAVRESFQDIRTHQAALLGAMYAAFTDFIDRLDPEELQNKFDRGMKRSALLGATNKMKYWDLYSELYQVMTQHTPGQFPHLFAEELARAYEQHADQSKSGQSDRVAKDAV